MAGSQRGVVERNYSCLQLILPNLNIDRERDIISVRYANGVFAVFADSVDDTGRVGKRSTIGLFDSEGEPIEREKLPAYATDEDRRALRVRLPTQAEALVVAGC